MPSPVTWADSERDLTAWNGNSLQKEALRYVYELQGYEVLKSGDEALIDDWRKPCDINTFTTWGLIGSPTATYTLTLVRIIHRMTRFFVYPT